jgi:hypothetical protein
MVYALVVLGLAIAAALAALRIARRRTQRLVEAGAVASDLIPEIRSILDATEASTLPAPSRFTVVRQQIPRLFREETLFAVETFYQCVDAYRDASEAMKQAFDGASASSLGDRIRAKDRRDRCLKDVYYTGQAAIERLSRLA